MNAITKPAEAQAVHKNIYTALAAAQAEMEMVASLRHICEDDWLPSRETVRKRLVDDAAFQGQYARAREAQADAIFDEILQIADDSRNDWMERSGEEDAGWIANGEHIQRSRLRIDARKWMAGKLRPKVYGDKIDLTHANPDGTRIEFKTIIEAKPK